MESDFEKQSPKRRKTEVEDNQSSKTGIELLPQDIIVDILSRIPITSLVQFKYVCKSWCSLAKEPFVVNNTTYPRNKSPCLILHCDFPIRNQLCFVDLSAHGDRKEKVQKFHLPFQSKMPEFDVVGSCNGLLCLSDSLYKDATYIYNPFTSNFMELPKSTKYHDQQVVFGFGFHPRTKEYKVVKLVYYRNAINGYLPARRITYPQSEVQVFTLGTSAWRSLGKAGYQLVRRPCEALINGKLHWVTRPQRYRPARRIISFDIADEEFMEVSQPDCGALNRCNYHLCVLKDCLAAIVYGNYGKLDVWVMKEYNVKESWVKEISVESYMPKGLKQNLEGPLKIWKNSSNGRLVRFLAVLDNGEILLEYKSRVLVSYDPKKGKFKDLLFQGIPKWFHTITHLGNFTWVGSTQVSSIDQNSSTFTCRMNPTDLPAEL